MFVSSVVFRRVLEGLWGPLAPFWAHFGTLFDMHLFEILELNLEASRGPHQSYE